MRKKLFSWKRLIASFNYAFQGLRILGGQQSFLVQLLVAILVVIFAFIIKLAALELAMIILAIGLVFILEIINTIIEKLLDHLHPQRHCQIALIKDAAAALVLIGCIVAFLVGSVIFGSKLLL